jgi:hypothetical protein
LPRATRYATHTIRFDRVQSCSIGIEPHEEKNPDRRMDQEIQSSDCCSSIFG